jgi:Fe-S-cluster containining protein
LAGCGAGRARDARPVSVRLFVLGGEWQAIFGQLAGSAWQSVLPLLWGTTKMTIRELLKFRCTGCGNCCKDPLLPLTHEDLAELASHTLSDPMKLVKFVGREAIDMDDEPEGFALLPQGRRVMVLKHVNKRCMYLGPDDRCTVYAYRPLGCRVFPFDPTFSRSGKLVRLTLIQATDCRYELNGHNSVKGLMRLNRRYDDALQRYHAKLAQWNQKQRGRKRRGQPVQSARKLLEFLGVVSERRTTQYSSMWPEG